MSKSDYTVMPAHAHTSVDVETGGKFPVRRIYCVGKNYNEHVKEMGGDIKKSHPVFFTKPADAIVASDQLVSFPSQTENLHFEGELVLALKSGGVNIPKENALQHIYGYAAGCDLTRRNLQADAKKKGLPWDSAKAFDQSAPIGNILPVDQFDGVILDSRLTTQVNNNVRQEAYLNEMIWGPAEIIASLSSFFELKAGDLIYTGTPSGVGPLQSDDKVEIIIDGLAPLKFKIIN